MRIILILLLLHCFSYSYSQVYATKNGFIAFHSQTPLEDIKAENKQLYAAIDPAKKNLGFSVLMKGFQFPKKLMQDHFNENYVESDKYPKANFTGSYTGDVDVSKPGVYKVNVKGALTLHGVTKNIEVPATIEIQAGKLIGKSTFKIAPADFNIQISALVKEKIAKQIDVQILVECTNTN